MSYCVYDYNLKYLYQLAVCHYLCYKISSLEKIIKRLSIETRIYLWLLAGDIIIFMPLFK